MCAARPARPLNLVDSFLVDRGRLVDPAGHRERMRSAARELWVDRPRADGDRPGVDVDRPGADAAVDRLYAEAAEQIAGAARGGAPLLFPRLTLQPDAEAPSGWRGTVELRPLAPERVRTTARLITHDGPDLRVLPRLKGPDMPWQDLCRERAIAVGADDAVLTGPVPPGPVPTDPRVAGAAVIREAAYGTLVAWDDGVLLLSAAAARLPSITEAALVRAVQSRGLHSERTALTEDLLRGADAVWLLSSLHTIREVTHLDDRALSTRPGAAQFRALIWERAEPIGALAPAEGDGRGA
ncbi:MAG: aminotransferase class IV [Dermabacter sp.]|nr:aminotransferase class IV [Dermabacter sp.]